MSVADGAIVAAGDRFRVDRREVRECCDDDDADGDDDCGGAGAGDGDVRDVAFDGECDECPVNNCE